MSQESQIQSILEDCEVLQTPYVDVDFAPRAESVGSLVGLPTFAAGLEPARLVWCRPYAPSSAAARFCASTAPVRQGRLFTAAHSPLWLVLALLGTSAAARARLFAGNVANRYGVYSVALHVRGRVQHVVVDDVFPCDAATRRPLCSACADPADAWASVVEKALAKAHGCYAAVYALPLSTLLEELFGCPVTLLKPAACAPADLWRAGCAALARGALVFATTRPGLLPESQVVLCTLSAHAELDGHALLRVTEVATAVKVPWRSAWAPGGPQYTPENAARLRKFVSRSSDSDKNKGKNKEGVEEECDELESKEEGKEKKEKGEENDEDDDEDDEEANSAWMTAEDFAAHFDSVSVVHSDCEWMTRTLETSLAGAANVFAVELCAPADVIVTARQPPQSAVGTRICVVGAARPHVPYGGTKEAFVVAPANATARLALPKGAFQVLVEVYSQHTARLPAPATVVLAATTSACTLEAVPDAAGAGPEWDFVLPEFAARNGLCAACQQPLAGRILTLKDNQRYHSFCFVCSQCQHLLGTQYFMREGKPICEACAKQG